MFRLEFEDERRDALPDVHTIRPLKNSDPSKFSSKEIYLAMRGTTLEYLPPAAYARSPRARGEDYCLSLELLKQFQIPTCAGRRFCSRLLSRSFYVGHQGSFLGVPPFSIGLPASHAGLDGS
jgi:hypothetical protein